MKTLMLSTTSGWNCGDDFIRWGLLRVLDLELDTRVLWWNRGWGIEDKYANALEVNLPHVDHVIMAGTPEWIDRNEYLLWYCLKHDVPISMLGVGRTGCFKGRHTKLVDSLAKSGLVQLAIPRDDIAWERLLRWGFMPTEPMCDPGMFVEPLPAERDLSVVCWRGVGEVGSRGVYGPPDPEDEDWYWVTGALQRAYAELPEPKIVVVHDNREIEAAEYLFGERVYYASDPMDMLRLYARCWYYVGTRIHGWVAALLHGAPAHLIYSSPKGRVVLPIIQRLGLKDSARVDFSWHGPGSAHLNLSPPDLSGLETEMERFRKLCTPVVPGMRLPAGVSE